MSHCANEITQLVIFVARQSVDINFELWLYRLQPWMAMGQPLRHLVSSIWSNGASNEWRCHQDQGNRFLQFLPVISCPNTDHMQKHEMRCFKTTMQTQAQSQNMKIHEMKHGMKREAPGPSLLFRRVPFRILKVCHPRCFLPPLPSLPSFHPCPSRTSHHSPCQLPPLRLRQLQHHWLQQLRQLRQLQRQPFQRHSLHQLHLPRCCPSPFPPKTPGSTHQDPKANNWINSKNYG